MVHEVCVCVDVLLTYGGVLCARRNAGMRWIVHEVKLLAAAMEGSHTLTAVNFLGQRVFGDAACVCWVIEGVCMHGAGNLPMGDTGVEAVVRMAATTPALKTLNLGGTCVRVGCGVRQC